MYAQNQHLKFEDFIFYSRNSELLNNAFDEFIRSDIKYRNLMQNFSLNFVLLLENNL